MESRKKNEKTVDGESPACEITRFSSVEWRARQDRLARGSEYSLLTVGPKGRNDSTTKTQVVSVPSDCDDVAMESSTESTKDHPLPNGRAYRLIINGRAEFMTIIGSIFGLRTTPGFYILIWPFKYLIKNEKKLRARLAEERSKYEDRGENHLPEVGSSARSDTGIISQGHEFQAEFRKERLDSSPIKENANEELTGSASCDPGHHADSKENEKYAEERGKKGLPYENKTVYKAKHDPTSSLRQEEGEVLATVTGQKGPQSIESHLRTENVTRLRDELRCIVEFMDYDMKEIFQVQKSIEHGTQTRISFDFLWLLFQPGDVVISRGEHDRAYIVLHVTGGRALDRSARKNHVKEKLYRSQYEQLEEEAYLAKFPKTSPFVLDCFYIDFDGTNFGPLAHKFQLAEYEGEVPIHSLEVFPVKFDDDCKQTERKLVKRGKRFVKMARVDHTYYSGNTFREPRILESQGEV